MTDRPIPYYPEDPAPARDPLEAVSEHNDTHTRCPACSQTFLFADAAECDGCETYLHAECRVTCESCSYQYCDTCQVGGVCEGCRHDARYKEASGGYLREA